MTEYPIIKKLRIKPGYKIAILNSPAGYLSSLSGILEDVEVDQELDGEYDLIHAFFSHSSLLNSQIEVLKSVLGANGILWISYPKQSAKKDTDLNRDILRESLLNQGLKAVSQISIDDTWSALRFKII